MIVFNRATYEQPDTYEPDPDPTGCLAEARFALQDALCSIRGYTARVIGNVAELESAKHKIKLALSALPGGD